MKRLMAAAALLTLISSATHAAPAPASPDDNSGVTITATEPVGNAPAWDFNHMGSGNDKSETLGSPYYNAR